MKKNIASILIIILGIGVLVGCGAKSQGENLLENETKPITFDWYINYSWFVTDWGTNLVSKEITKRTGVDVNFITPIGSEEEKVKALIASDSLPDLITLGWWDPQLQVMIDNGMVYALNELADQYDPDLYQVTDPAVMNWYTQEDGNIYGYPNSAYTPEDVEKHDNIAANLTFLVRKDMYEAIGSPDMTTKEGFYHAICEAAKQFPEVNGEPLIPLGGDGFDETGCRAFDQYLQNFLAIPYEKDGKYYDRNTDPEYLSWLKLLRKLNEEGYLQPDIFVDQRTQISEKIAEGRYFCIIYQRTDMADQQKMLYATDPDSIYMAVDGPKNENGDEHILSTAGVTGWTVTMISKNCKDPEKAIKLLDFLMSKEGQMLTSVGVEGETYEIVDGKVVLKEEVRNILNTDRLKYDALYGADNAYWMLQDNAMQAEWMPPLEEPIRQMAEWTYPYVEYMGQYEVRIVEDSELGIMNTKLKKLWSTTLKQLLLAESEEKFDQILADYLVEREAMGFSIVHEELNRRMHVNKKKLDLE